MKEKPQCKRFWLKRNKDVSGISGTGIVAEGVIFENGKCVMSWLTQYSSVCVYENIQTLEKIHSHEGATEIIFEE